MLGAHRDSNVCREIRHPIAELLLPRGRQLGLTPSSASLYGEPFTSVPWLYIGNRAKSMDTPMYFAISVWTHTQH